MNACDNISGLSRELVLLAISFTTAELRVFCTGLCQRGVTSADFFCHVLDNSPCDKRPPRRCRKVCRHRDIAIIWTGQSSGCSSFRSRQPTASPISRNGSKRRLLGRRVSLERDHWQFHPLSVNDVASAYRKIHWSCCAFPIAQAEKRNVSSSSVTTFFSKRVVGP